MAVIDETNADLIQGGVSIVVASRDAHNVPVIARALACSASSDRRRITLLLRRSASAAFLDAVGAGGPIAAVYCQPSTHYSIQLKAQRAVISTVDQADVLLAERHADNFVAEVCPLGHPEMIIRTLLWTDPSDLVAVSFVPVARSTSSR